MSTVAILGARTDDRHPDGSSLADLMSKIGLHEHVCMIYERQEDRLSAAVPFLKIGLQRRNA